MRKKKPIGFEWIDEALALLQSDIDQLEDSLQKCRALWNKKVRLQKAKLALEKLKLTTSPPSPSFAGVASSVTTDEVKNQSKQGAIEHGR